MRQIVFSLCHWEHEGSERLCSLSRITQPSKSLRPAPSLAAQPSCCFPQHTHTHTHTHECYQHGALFSGFPLGPGLWAPLHPRHLPLHPR